MDHAAVMRFPEGDERVEEIQKQMAYLAWRKNQVEGKIRKFTVNAKRHDEVNTLKQIQVSMDSHAKKNQWTEEIVTDELSKPLELSRQYLLDFEEMQKKKENADEITTLHHIKAIQETVTRAAASVNAVNPEVIRSMKVLERSLQKSISPKKKNRL